VSKSRLEKISKNSTQVAQEGVLLKRVKVLTQSGFFYQSDSDFHFLLWVVSASTVRVVETVMTVLFPGNDFSESTATMKTRGYVFCVRCIHSRFLLLWKYGLFFSIFGTSGLFFPIFENKPKIHIIFHQIGGAPTRPCGCKKRTV
jgi:hypothetical protein